MRWLERLLQEHEDRRAEQLDEYLAEVVWLGNGGPRVLDNELVPIGQAYRLPADLFADGHARLVVNPHTYLRAEVMRDYGIDAAHGHPHQTRRGRLPS